MEFGTLPLIINGLYLNNEKSIFCPDLPGRPSPGSDLQEKQSRAGEDRCPVRGSRADDHRRRRLRDQFPRPVREAAGVRRPDHPGQRNLGVRLPGHLRFRHALLRVHLRRLVQGLRPRDLYGFSPTRHHEDPDDRKRKLAGIDLYGTQMDSFFDLAVGKELEFKNNNNRKIINITST